MNNVKVLFRAAGLTVESGEMPTNRSPRLAFKIGGNGVLLDSYEALSLFRKIEAWVNFDRDVTVDEEVKEQANALVDNCEHWSKDEVRVFAGGLQRLVARL